MFPSSGFLLPAPVSPMTRLGGSESLLKSVRLMKVWHRHFNSWESEYLSSIQNINVKNNVRILTKMSIFY